MQLCPISSILDGILLGLSIIGTLGRVRSVNSVGRLLETQRTDYCSLRKLTCRYCSEDYPVPSCEQVLAAELLEKLPAAVQRISPEQRNLQMTARRRGVCKRFRA